MTEGIERSTILGGETYTQAEHNDYLNRLHALEAQRPPNGHWWLLEGVLPTSAYNALLARRIERLSEKTDVASRAGSVAVNETLLQPAEGRGAPRNSWHAASRYVAASERLLKPKLIGGRPRVPHSWLKSSKTVDKLVEPREYISNAHKPERVVSLPPLCGDYAVYTKVNGLGVVENLLNDTKENSAYTHDIAIFPPFTKRAENFLKNPAKRKGGEYTQLAALHRVRDGSTVLRRHMIRLKPIECTEAQSAALEIAARKTFEELEELERYAKRGERPPQGTW